MQVGDTVGDYVVEAELGAGGMAKVYRARHSILDTFHAIKALNPEYRDSAEARRRFLDEAKIQAKHLQHPNIVRVTNIIATADVAALVMDLVDGGSLDDHIAGKRRPFTAAEFLAMAHPILDAMEHAHAAGIIHRDLKPANILLSRKPHGLIPMITDFGIAKLNARDESSGKRSTHHDARMGTVGYSSPEQIVRAKDVTARSDLFSLGAVFFEMLTGRPPFPGDSEFEIMEKIVRGRLEPLEGFADPGLPPAICTAIRRALDPSPEKRFASCRELGDALGAIATAGEGATPVRTRPPAERTVPVERPLARGSDNTTPATPTDAGPAATALMALAQEHHFAKRFGEAKHFYEQVVKEFGASKQAIKAGQQLENLKAYPTRSPDARVPREALPPVAAVPAPTSASTVLQAAMRCHYAKQFEDARAQYQQLIESWPESKEARVAQQQLANLRRS